MTATNIQEITEDELRKLDSILIIDHSGSMGEPSLRMSGKNKLEEVQEDAIAIARIAQKYDDDGLTVIAFSSAVKTYDGVTADRVASVFKEFPARGSTALHLALGEAIGKVRSSKKEGVILVFTDGAPDDHDAVVRTIKGAAKELGRPKIGFTIIQVGEDPGASKFLDDLDNHMQGVPDIVATVKAAQAEGLTLQQLAWLARNA